jgi:hypothetical protein
MQAQWTCVNNALIKNNAFENEIHVFHIYIHIYGHSLEFNMCIFTSSYIEPIFESYSNAYSLHSIYMYLFANFTKKWNSLLCIKKKKVLQHLDLLKRMALEPSQQPIWCYTRPFSFLYFILYFNFDIDLKVQM